MNMLHFFINSNRAWAMQQPQFTPMPPHGSGLGESVVNESKMFDTSHRPMSSTLDGQRFMRKNQLGCHHEHRVSRLNKETLGSVTVFIRCLGRKAT